MKIRTDFVTNSSSSSFTVAININLKNGKTIAYKDTYCDMSNGEIFVSVSPKELAEAKNIEEMISLLKDNVVNRDPQSLEKGDYMRYYLDSKRRGSKKGKKFIERLSTLKSMDEIKSITIVGDEQGMDLDDNYYRSVTYDLESEETLVEVKGEDFEKDGSSGGDLWFGDLNWDDYSDESINVKKYIDQNGNCVLPDGIKAIAENAFEGRYNLKSITIPGSVTEIEDNAFYYCPYLECIDVDESNSRYKSKDGVLFDFDERTLIKYPAGKISKKHITIPDSVTEIGDHAFSYCSSLTSITIPDGVKKIGYSAFSRCSNLTSITIPDSVTEIGDSAFLNCSSLTSITIPDSVTEIGSYAFSYCSSLTSITIPDSVTEIGFHTFDNCSGLTSITIPDSVTEIGSYAFKNCNGLTNITIPESVTRIGDNVFQGCHNLECIDVEESNRWYKSKDGILFDFGEITIIKYPEGKISKKHITIPDSVTEIGDHAFSYCSSLTSITIPDGVKKIGYSAFSRCSGLTSITIPDSVTEIGDYAFENCSGLTSITIPDSVTEIGDYTFENCSGLTSITIPDGLKKIGEAAFLGCSSLTDITIPNEVTDIRKLAFKDCSGLTCVTIPESVTKISANAFNSCKNLTITAPKDSFAAEYAKKYKIKLNEI